MHFIFPHTHSPYESSREHDKNFRVLEFMRIIFFFLHHVGTHIIAYHIMQFLFFFAQNIFLVLIHNSLDRFAVFMKKKTL